MPKFDPYQSPKNTLYWISILMAFFLIGMTPVLRSSTIMSGDCTRCHICSNPDKSNPCLRECTRPGKHEMDKISGHAELGPESMILNTISMLYEGVNFNHKEHAEMGEMGIGCVECHHQNPKGQYLKCSQCHSPQVTCENMPMLGLKGAYHRQCIPCHGQWSNYRQCERCHRKKGTAPPAAATMPELAKQPKIVTYSTSFMDSTVSFDHTAHTADYELECRQCHRGVGCAPCHALKNDQEKHTAFTSGCLKCHENTGCMDCHITAGKSKSFDHSRTEFPLKTYHQGLDCRKCHSTEDRHDTAPVSCGMCHKKGWNPATFDHGITGLKLDSIHGGEACEKCHPDLDFRKSANCVICHDADFQFPSVMPGERLKIDPDTHHKSDQSHSE